ncbi:MAG TPA: hypothetical protein VMI11_03005, partial [Actinomycetes bacterium]|nr:hypothetical protein [Actinomycetes bacterium]
MGGDPDRPATPAAPSAGSRRRGSRAALVGAVVLALLWLANQLGVAAGAIPGRPLPWLWLAVPLAVIGLRDQRPWPWLSRACDAARRLSPALLAVGIVALVSLVWALAQRVDPYFGHDEAVYATKARALAGIAPASQWEIYRPPLLPVLGAPVTALGGGVLALRLITLVLAVATLAVLAWSAGAREHPRRAAVTVLLFVCGFAFLRRLPEFLNDLAAAGLLLAAAELVVRSRRPGQARLLVAASGLAVVGFYLRYGVLLGLAAIVLGAVAAFGVRTWARPLRPTLVAAGVFVLGLMPHLIWAWATVGTPWGVLTVAEGVAGRTYLGQGLLEYAVSIPWLYVGDVGGLVMAAGVVAGYLGLRARVRGSATEADLRSVVLSVAAITQVVVLGITAHGEERFVFFPLMALLVVGVDAIARWAGAWSAPVLLVAACAALLGMPATLHWIAHVSFKQVTDERRSIASAATHVPRSNGCLVVTGYRPEMGWDTRCATVTRLDSVPAALRAGRVVTVVRFSHGRY